MMMKSQEETFEPTDAEMVILNASDREIEAMQAATKLELLNLQVAKKAGWTDIKVWNPSAIKKSFVGVNLAHPELGVHIPDYTQSLDAIVKVFELLDIEFELTRLPIMPNGAKQYITYSGNTNRQKDLNNPALALCKLLLAINPNPIAPLLKEEAIAVIDDDGEIEEPTVIEACFG